MYEQNKVHHIGCFPELEDQMCSFVPEGMDSSPDRVDALVWGFTELLVRNQLPEFKREIVRHVTQVKMSDQTTIDKICGSQHPRYRDQIATWQYFHDHYVGGPAYVNKTNPLYAAPSRIVHDLVGANKYRSQYSLESNINYLIRASRGCFVDLCSLRLICTAVA
jgi:hypothetical protein